MERAEDCLGRAAIGLWSRAELLVPGGSAKDDFAKKGALGKRFLCEFCLIVFRTYIVNLKAISTLLFKRY